MIIDFHVHTFPAAIRDHRDRYFDAEPEFKLLYESPQSKLVSTGDIIAMMDEQEVDMSVVFGFPWHTPDTCRQNNDYVLEAVAKYPDRLRGLCCVDSLNPDAAAFAADAGLSLEEANQWLKFQETIGDIQPLLMADLPDSFGGLWVEHEPAYRIVIALTEGDEKTIQPYIEGADWAEFVEVRPVTYTLEELEAAQAVASQAAGWQSAACR